MDCTGIGDSRVERLALLMMQGAKNGEIARALGCGVRTVTRWRGRPEVILRVLELQSKQARHSDAMMQALQQVELEAVKLQIRVLHDEALPMPDRMRAAQQILDLRGSLPRAGVGEPTPVLPAELPPVAKPPEVRHRVALPSRGVLRRIRAPQEPSSKPDREAPEPARPTVEELLKPRARPPWYDSSCTQRIPRRAVYGGPWREAGTPPPVPD